MAKPFKGIINVDVRDSTPDWQPFAPAEAPAGAPNVLIVLYDDTGIASWSPYGGRINMPTMQRLADNGLTYTQWHTTALCSPTRSCLLTGRNHHQNGYACIAEGATGFPGSNGHIPWQNAFLAQVMRDEGYGTFWVGKNHNVPSEDWDTGGSKQTWPLARGFDRFYGFIGGETDQWYPTLISDNHYVDQPSLPQDGYHLSKDLTDQAIRMIRDTKQSAPDKPWYMFFCPGVNHAPHQAPQEYIDKYKGMFDDGYEAYREWVLPRMIEKGVMPQGTELSPINPMTEGTFSPADIVRPWDDLSDDEKRLFARMAEVFAGFSEYTAAQVGRIVDYLEESGQLDNTIVFYCADNGASGEGSPDGSVNENKFFNGFPDDIEENLAMIDKLGSPETYNHYPTGWAFGFSTPFRMFKRYSYQGGICDPLVISWPKGIKAKGEVRNQYHHAIDIVPTILECCGLEFPQHVLGYEQTPLAGVSMKYSFDAAPDTPTQKTTQYYAMLGTRGLWHEGWKVVAEHGPLSSIGNFDKDNWQLFHTDVDRAEAHDLSSQYPEKVNQLVNVWFAEAGKYDVLPLDDRTAMEIILEERPVSTPPRGLYKYYPDTTEVSERTAASTRGRSFKILADVDVADADANGVLYSHGARFGGHVLFVKDRKLHYVYNFLGIPPEQHIVSTADVAPGRHVLGVDFAKESVDDHGATHGTATLYIDDAPVGSAPIRTQPGHFSLCGEGMCIGRDSGDPVSAEYGLERFQYEFTGGEITVVEVSVGDDQYVDLEKEAMAMMADDAPLPLSRSFAQSLACFAS